MLLRNKNAMVTGGSRGIGRSICLALAKNGANVAFTYFQDEKSAHALKEEIISLRVGCQMFQTDVRDREKLAVIFSNLAANWGRLDVLVNNAGINKPTDFDEITDDDWDEILSVNLKGAFVVTQEALNLLKKSTSGSIINIGSVSGQYGGPRTAHYAVSKAGLNSLSQVVARFGAKFGIRCNTLAVGLISSDMGNAGLKASTVSKAAESILLGRLGTKDEVAKAVCFLASSDSEYITAQTININGGLYF